MVCSRSLRLVGAVKLALCVVLLAWPLCDAGCADEPEGWCGNGSVCLNGGCLCPEGMRHDDTEGSGGPCIQNPGGFAVYKSLCLAGVLLLIGKFLRMTVPLFQKAFLPASIIAGLGFFGVLQTLFFYPGTRGLHKAIIHEYTEGWSNIGPFAIDVLFASLFLGADIPTPSEIVNKAGPQFVYNQVVNWGQFTVAALTVIIIIYAIPGMPSSPYLAVLVPAGFTGGHSFIFALAEELEGSKINYSVGVGVGLYMATIGQIFSFVLGVAWVNRAEAKNMLVARPKQASQSDLTEQALFARGLFSPEAMPSAGKQTCSPDSMDVLSLHAGVIFLCLLLGVSLWEYFKDYVQRFLFCMGFGIIFQLIYTALVRRGTIPPLIDASIMARLQGLILDFLIVTAVSTLDVRQIIPLLPAATIACFTTLAWCGFCTWYIAPHFLPDYWFERAICEYGQCTGVISSGLILLKMCDPRQTLPVMDSFALKNFAAMPLVFTWLPQTLGFVNTYGIFAYTGVSAAGLVVFVGIWFFFYRPKFQRLGVGNNDLATPQEISGLEMYEVSSDGTKARRRRSEHFSRVSTNFL